MVSQPITGCQERMLHYPTHKMEIYRHLDPKARKNGMSLRAELITTNCECFPRNNQQINVVEYARGLWLRF